MKLLVWLTLALVGDWVEVSWTSAVEEGWTLSVVTICQAGRPLRAVTTLPLEPGQTRMRVRRVFVPASSKRCMIGAGIFPDYPESKVAAIEWAEIKLED